MFIFNLPCLAPLVLIVGQMTGLLFKLVGGRGGDLFKIVLQSVKMCGDNDILGSLSNDAE